MLAPAVLILLAYLVGSVPSGYLLVRASRGLDVRHYGSRSIGATNVCRVGGRWLGLSTLLADAGKALGIVVLTAACMPSPAVIAGAAFAVMLGHAYSLWFLLWERRFSEGKSVACALGIVVGLVCIGSVSWWSAGVPVLAWLAGLLAPRLLTGRWWHISPATMLAAVSFPLTMCWAQPGRPYLLLSFAMAMLILVRHKNNIKRLLAGTEPRLGDRTPLHRASPARSPAGRAEGEDAARAIATGALPGSRRAAPSQGAIARSAASPPARHRLLSPARRPPC